MPGGSAPSRAGPSPPSFPLSGGVVALAFIDPWLCLTFLVGIPTLLAMVRSCVQDSSALADRTCRYTEGSPLKRAAGAVATGRGARGGRRGARGRISPGQTLAPSQYVMLAAGLGSALMSVPSSPRPATGRNAEILAEPAARYARKPAHRVWSVGISGYHRPCRRKASVLDGVDLVVPVGALVAVVGLSGGGKSVLAALAGRLLDPDEGKVLLDGVALPRLDHRELYCAACYGFERPVLLGKNPRQRDRLRSTHS
jgi:ATP-binding cassette, subfamily B, bacterial RamA/AmfB